ncbi:MAG: hypothetical protein H7067_09030 [Burkholderiales bacterium]|nr:hypothetical protein [Opitutaceae bacterium]
MAFDLPAAKSAAAQSVARTDALKKALAPFASAIGETDAATLYAAVAKARAELDETLLTLATHFGEAESSSFADFLGGVGEAAVDAQRKLDAENLRATRDALAQGATPSGVFRLPRLEAEVKFAFSRKQQSKLGLVFYSRGSSQEERNEQSLKFEIVSTPPPPELLQLAARHAGLSLAPELDAGLRARIRGLLLAATTKVLGDTRNPAATYDEHKTVAASDAEFARVVILPAERPGDDTYADSFFLLYATEAVGHALGIWFVNLREKSLRVVWTLKSKGTQEEDVDVLRAWIRRLGGEQAALLPPPS